MPPILNNNNNNNTNLNTTHTHSSPPLLSNTINTNKRKVSPSIDTLN